LKHKSGLSGAGTWESLPLCIQGFPAQTDCWIAGFQARQSALEDASAGSDPFGVLLPNPAASRVQDASVQRHLRPLCVGSSRVRSRLVHLPKKITLKYMSIGARPGQKRPRCSAPYLAWKPLLMPPQSARAVLNMTSAGKFSCCHRPCPSRRPHANLKNHSCPLPSVARTPP